MLSLMFLAPSPHAWRNCVDVYALPAHGSNALRSVLWDRICRTMRGCEYAATGRIPRGRTSVDPVMISFIRGFWTFLRIRKKFWLLPIVIMIVSFIGLIVLTQIPAIAPFIYIF
jgi:Family of unknown function (DUF5989)